MTLENVKAAAIEFLNIADELNEKVSAYIDGSNDKDAEKAYWMVREGWTYGLNYELAESFI